ncbi:MAG TPA: hypothetical protein PKA27_10050 [Fimbriimonadaceae bacterium]|mgnify:CR=1 FL=1|nr:hypothetical protein [Fimbriimonadaceae bacterium]
MRVNWEREGIYVGFILFVGMSLLVTEPVKDLVSLDYGVLATNYSGLLASLGGFAITVLAVLLGLEAIDAGKNSEAHRAAHTLVVKHVSISLAIASVTCFVSANMLSEVGALNAGLLRSKDAVRTELRSSLSGIKPKQTHAEIDQFLSGLERGAVAAEPQIASMAGWVAPHQIEVLTGSTRRHLLIAGVPAFLASFLILQSLSYLLTLRFPRSKSIWRLQSLACAAIGGMLLVKLVHGTGYDLLKADFRFSRYAVFAVLVLSIAPYALWLRSRRSEGSLPLLPYGVSLVVCFAGMAYLAQSFSSLSGISTLDRAYVILGALLPAGLLLSVQLERPTLKALESHDD